MHNNQDLISKIERSFAPLITKIRFHDHGEYIGFRVYYPDTARFISSTPIDIDHARYRNVLDLMIGKARGDIERDGVLLYPLIV